MPSMAARELQSTYVSSLLKSFDVVPPASVTAIIDCVLASAASLSAYELFCSLLHEFPLVLKDVLQKDDAQLDDSSGKESATLDPPNSNFVLSYVNSLFHLVKNSQVDGGAMRQLIWKCIIPLLHYTSSNGKDLLNEIVETLCDAVCSLGCWELMEETLVPFCLRLVGLHVGINRSTELAVFRWRKDLIVGSQNHRIKDSESLSLPIACQVLTSLLEASLRASSFNGSPSNDHSAAVVQLTAPRRLSCKLMWDISGMTTEMLSQHSESRSCAIHFLLPHIFRAFSFIPSLEVVVQEQSHVMSRGCFSRRIWACCATLFDVGQPEGIDAFHVLSLYATFFLNAKYYQGHLATDFNIRGERKFWEEIKRGLVDSEPSTRKLSLYILKLSLGDRISHHSCDNSSMPVSCLESDSLNGGIDVCAMGASRSGITKRERWANKEAESLGVGLVHNVYGQGYGVERWKAFFLLYEMLEEYGTHLVEAAWAHQVLLLVQSVHGNMSARSDSSNDIHSHLMETSNGMVSWLAVLWERGFFHENPQVRCLVMESFLTMEWEKHAFLLKKVPVKFVLGPFTQALNDVAHHQDFGLRGVYSSTTIVLARKFLSEYCYNFPKSVRIAFLCCLASVTRREAFGRPGLMALAYCLSSAACRLCPCPDLKSSESELTTSEKNKITEDFGAQNAADLLDALGTIIERSRHHFNPNYRLQVCEQVLETASSIIEISDVPVDVLLYFVSTMPREFTTLSGPLRRKIQDWFSRVSISEDNNSCLTGIIETLSAFPENFVKHQPHSVESICFDDDDLVAWDLEVDRWARVFFLIVGNPQHLAPTFEFLKNYGRNICNYDSHQDNGPVKFLLVILRLIQELQIGSKRVDYFSDNSVKYEVKKTPTLGQLSSEAIPRVYEYFREAILHILDDLLQYAKTASAIFFCDQIENEVILPDSVKGKLGGPSQRRLTSFTTTSVMQAIASLKTAASLLTCSKHIPIDAFISTFHFLWDFAWKVIHSKKYFSETGSELQLAACEALMFVIKAFSVSFSPVVFDLVLEQNRSSCQSGVDKPVLDIFLFSFLESVNGLIANGILTRSRRAILMNWKWHCLDALLSFPYGLPDHGVSGHLSPLYSCSTLKKVLLDIIGSLENASDTSALPMFRCVRLIMGLLTCDRETPLSVLFEDINFEKLMQQLVHSSWILHVSCNKRRVAPISALVSSVLHPAVFPDVRLHETIDGQKGPLKWSCILNCVPYLEVSDSNWSLDLHDNIPTMFPNLFIEQLLEEGTKSPRTIRLAACHLTGLWYLYPKIIKYYMKELKLLSLHGSVAFDEDFEAELSENSEATTEIQFLAQSPYSEFMEEFINTEMYARVSVAILFHKLAEMVNSMQTTESSEVDLFAHESGKMFLLELLDSAVNDKDLSKELYKKYSAVHRRKVRAWQMICILCHFVEDDIIQQVTSMLHTCLYRNNLPAVRQYLETFAIQIYLKFPVMAETELVPTFNSYNMRPQALSSYVFIAANVITHTCEPPVQLNHLNKLLPPIFPLLTSHHHSLRGITQVLVYHVLCKFFPPFDSDNAKALSLEKNCFEKLKSYLRENVDCSRLRASMEGFLDSFDPKMLATPAGIFNARAEGSDFECVPLSLVEQVIKFLNDVREDLRNSMAKDALTIRSERLKCCYDFEKDKAVSNEKNECLPESLDFQKKITLQKHDDPSSTIDYTVFDVEFPSALVEMEKEDLLLGKWAHSKAQAIRQIQESRQQFIIVASLLDRIPNLAGLARTCEIFKATGLVVADAMVLKDKQFQLISVTAEKWVPIIEVPVNSLKMFLQKKKVDGFSLLGLEQTANSRSLDRYTFPTKTVLVLGREKEGIPVDIIHMLDDCVEIPQFGIIRSLNVHVSGAIALWEYTRQQRCKCI